jgi:hypothetical protein
MKDLRLEYDSICYHLMYGLKNLSEGADYIYLKNFDRKNEEHMLVISIAVACNGVLDDKPIIVDCDFFSRRKLAKKYKKVVKADKIKSKNVIKMVDTDLLLEGLRGYACELCGNEFRYGDIYRAFYGD